MKVETFILDEIATEHPEVSDEAKKIISEMGLTGQERLLSDMENGGVQTRVPFRTMTADELFTYRVLCPATSKLRDYSADPIPYRVLEVAAGAEKTGFFEDLQVWSRRSAEIKDPVLVGIRKDNYDRSWFILARWGEELENFVDLKAKAVKQYLEDRLVKLQKIKAEVEREIASTKAGVIIDNPNNSWDADIKSPSFSKD